MEETNNGQNAETAINAKPVAIVAGANGDLGLRITRHLVQRGATVKALVRKGKLQNETKLLQEVGVDVVEVDYNNTEDLVQACKGASCVVSALSGLREVIVDVQTALLNAAVKAGVPRFIPSDYCIDYTKLSQGSNRNLDLRREFSGVLEQSPIQATSILNGMFADLLQGTAPVVLFGLKRVVYWGNANQPLDFTTIDNTAEFTAAAALDNTTPRWLRIAGDMLSSHGLKEAASRATGQQFKLLRPGGLGLLKTMISITKTLAPQKGEVFPPWQGMQYLHNMYTGLPKLHPLDNDRYKGIRWTPVSAVLAARPKK